MSLSSPAIPLRMMISLLKHHDDDRLEHEVRIGLSGVREPLYEVRIESLFGEWSNIRDWYRCDNDLGIPERILNHFIFTCHDMLLHQMMEHAGHGASRQFSCARRWLQTNFLTEEAELIADALEDRIVPGVVEHDRTHVDFG